MRGSFIFIRNEKAMTAPEFPPFPEEPQIPLDQRSAPEPSTETAMGASLRRLRGDTYVYGVFTGGRTYLSLGHESAQTAAARNQDPGPANAGANPPLGAAPDRAPSIPAMGAGPARPMTGGPPARAPRMREPGDSSMDEVADRLASKWARIDEAEAVRRATVNRRLLITGCITLPAGLITLGLGVADLLNR